MCFIVPYDACFRRFYGCFVTGARLLTYKPIIFKIES